MQLTEDFLVLLECTAVLTRTHEVVVGRAAVVTAADGSTGLSTHVATLKHTRHKPVSGRDVRILKF